MAMFATVVTLSLAPAAFASSFTVTSTGFSISGTANPIAPGNFDFTITGSSSITLGATTYSYTTQAANSTIGGHSFGNDNKLVNHGAFSTAGLLIQITSGSLNGEYVFINYDSSQGEYIMTFWKMSGTNLVKDSAAHPTQIFDSMFSPLTMTPEPSSIFLFGTGALLLAFLMFRRRRSTQTTMHPAAPMAA
jgi:hypothetical protein